MAVEGKQTDVENMSNFDISDPVPDNDQLFKYSSNENRVMFSFSANIEETPADSLISQQEVIGQTESVEDLASNHTQTCQSRGENDHEKESDTEKDTHEQVFRPSIRQYFFTELTRGYWLEHDEAHFTEKTKKVYTFMKIPREVEVFMLYGFFQCVDVFLYVFTFLPLRLLMALGKLCYKIVFAPCWDCNTRRKRLLEPAQVCDLLKGVIIIVCCLLLNYVDVSMMYHLIRGQAIIKLYIFFNMLEVADKLFSSFGQDILDSLFWTATQSRARRRDNIGVIPHVIMAIIYVSLHSILVLFQATTLNVAFNSHNKALLTIMMSNNFVELKGSVFKRFEKNNLFQMSCSDVRERFHFVVLLFIVCVRNLTEFQWNMDHLWVLVPDVVIVMVAEVMVDWVKHAFITKFNEIPEEVYRDYTTSIAYDMAISRQKNAFSDHQDVVSRRMGFIPLPLAVILIRVVGSSVRINGFTSVLAIILLYCCVMTFKMLNTIVLLGIASDYIKESKEKKRAARREETAKETATATSTPIKSSLKRSQSVGAKLNKSTSEVLHDFEEGVVSPPPSAQLNSVNKLLFSNSTVSLESVALNEEFIKDAAVVAPSDGTEVKKRSPQKQHKSLRDVDRYTMCSNRII